MSNEPRALTAALSQPAFVTLGGGRAVHAATRHVERYAPESTAGAAKSRPLKNLGFVDRLVKPWFEAAQRSPSRRMFAAPSPTVGGSEHSPAAAASWVMPRPWFQDEIDWMTAARTVGGQDV